ncbi:hypothetical protein PLICRDRAFT_30589 [Plicaturopsis crispa FD-325 SS-3]|nr:hypothetical protein PLICRDRAFT_30589 [Plicaturopsis crispa FD-325 SS-3]
MDRKNKLRQARYPASPDHDKKWETSPARDIFNPTSIRGKQLSSQKDVCPRRYRYPKTSSLMPRLDRPSPTTPRIDRPPPRMPSRSARMRPPRPVGQRHGGSAPGSLTLRLNGSRPELGAASTAIPRQLVKVPERMRVLRTRIDVRHIPIGHGKTSVVVRSLDTTQGTIVAIKFSETEAHRLEKRMLDYMGCHGSFAAKSKHFVHLLDVAHYHRRPCLVFNQYGTNIAAVLSNNNLAPFSPWQIHAMASQLGQALAYLREIRVIHTCIQAEHVILNSDRATRMVVSLDNNQHAVRYSGTNVREDVGNPVDVDLRSCVKLVFPLTVSFREKLGVLEGIVGNFSDATIREIQKVYPSTFTDHSPRTVKTDNSVGGRYRDTRGCRSGYGRWDLTSYQNLIQNDDLRNVLSGLLELDHTRRVAVQDALAKPYFRLQGSRV